VIINTIGLWERFYDLPVALRRIDCVQKLETRLGEVQWVDLSYPNYVRVRVMFSLAKALVPEANVRIRGRGDMKVAIWYENVPLFCFICSRVGHLDGEVGDDTLNFGVELRACPLKRLCEIKVQTKPIVVRFMNFEGAQRARLQEEVTSSIRSANFRVEDSWWQPDEDQEEVADHANPIPHEDEQELMKGVEDIDVAATDKVDELVYGLDGLRQRVSLGTHMGSEGEPPVEDTYQYGGDPSPMLHVIGTEKKLLKTDGSSRINNDKIKRKGLSSYYRLGRVLDVGKKVDVTPRVSKPHD
jgi:hypothetical protein